MPSLAIIPARHAPLAAPDFDYEGTADLQEVAEALGISYNNAVNRASRGHWRTAPAPSRKHSGRTEMRVIIPSLPPDARRRLMRLRRRKEREEQGLPKHHGGLPQREDDGRLALTDDDKLNFLALWRNRSQPSVVHIVDTAAALCMRCHLAPMKPYDGTGKSRYMLYRCQNSECGWKFSYSSVWRFIDKLPPETRDCGRLSPNMQRNKYHRFADRSHTPLWRNAKVYGDHHPIDVHCWDPRHPRLAPKADKIGEPRLIRLWLSEWKDYQTGVVGWAVGERANTELLMLAYRNYVERWGVPEETWADFGKDYRSEQFKAFLREIGSEPHHTTPSKRGGVSHARSKGGIEGGFARFEEGAMREMKTWCGSTATEAKDKADVLYPLLHKHRELVFGGCAQGKTDVPTVEEVRATIKNWFEEHYLVTGSQVERRNYLSPKDAFMADAHPLRQIGDKGLDRRAFDILLMERKARVLRTNGVKVSGRNYWHPAFAGMRGSPVTVRCPDDLGYAVVSVKTPGRPDLVVEAEARPFAGWSKEDFLRWKYIEKEENMLDRGSRELDAKRREGITPYMQVLAEKAALAQPERIAVNGAALMTEGHRIARALGTRDRQSPDWPIGPNGSSALPGEPDDGKVLTFTAAALADTESPEEVEEVFTEITYLGGNDNG